MESGLVIQLSLLMMLFGIIAYFKAVAAYRALRVHPTPDAMGPPERDVAVSSTTVPGADRALAHPPALEVALRQMHQVAPGDRYRLPLGWYLAPDGPRVAFATLVRGVNHLAITGQSESGKDNAALGMLLALAAQHSPSDLQLCLVDGKGLDFAPFMGKVHVWRLALRPAEIAPAMRALTAERERRAELLRRAGVSKWDEYQGGDLPLLVSYISELSLLQDAVGARDLEAWLNSELASGRAFGMRYIVATQTLSNFGTRWRSQIGLFLAGFQPSASQDAPNAGLTTAELRAAGGVPPSELPPPSSAAGVFSAVEGRQAITLRATYLDTPTRRRWLALLPDRPGSGATESEALPDAAEGATRALERPGAALPAVEAVAPQMAPEAAQEAPDEASSSSAVAVTPAEQAAILAARDELLREQGSNGEQPSRRAICRRAFKGATGGAAYRKVQAVLSGQESTKKYIPQEDIVLPS